MIANAIVDIWDAEGVHPVAKYEDDLKVFRFPMPDGPFEDGGYRYNYDCAETLVHISSLNVPWHEEKGDESFTFGGLYTAPYFPVGIHWSPYGFLEFMWSPCGFSYSGPTQICVFSWTPARLQLESKSTTWNPGSPPHGPNMESRSTLCKVDK
jgi:hypothetical protein